VAGNEPFHVPASKILERYANASIRADLYRAGIRDAAGVIGTFVAAGGPLRDWAASAPLHTDDSVILEFSAPRNLYRNEEMGIADALSKIQGSPFDDVVMSSPLDEPSHRFKNRVSDVIDARLAVFPGLRQWRDGSQAQALETLIEGYKRDPGNPVVYEVILRLRAEVMGQAPRATPSEVVQKQFEQIDRLPEPMVVSPKGATLPEIARKFVARAQRSSAASQLPMTIDWLLQAHELAPDNGGVVANLALVRTQNREIDQAEQLLAQFLQAHPQDGRANYAASVLALERQKPDESLRHLELALKSGVVKPGQLTADTAFAPLRDNSTFQALLHRYASSQPGAK
jgi:tetratricopeptide (TPR) repeat protein